jgi:hypothetical protein
MCTGSGTAEYFLCMLICSVALSSVKLRYSTVEIFQCLFIENIVRGILITYICYLVALLKESGRKQNVNDLFQNCNNY